MNLLEKLFYEIRPYLFLTVGLFYFHYNHSTLLAAVSELTLICCGISVVYMRLSYRGQLAVIRQFKNRGKHK